jgi:hypothetical protein
MVAKTTVTGASPIKGIPTLVASSFPFIGIHRLLQPEG